VSNVDAIYITIAAPDATREPTLAEYELMTNHTADYFDAYFTGYYYDDADSSFFRTEPILKDTLYDAGVSTERFIVYSTWNFLPIWSSHPHSYCQLLTRPLL
jgi:hypothetical protein